jgi:RHS repeat-associated protein
MGEVAFEVTSAGVQVAYVHVAGKALAQLSADGQFYWQHQNHLGSARALTNTSGAVVYWAQHDPHGIPLAEGGNPALTTRRFAGHERDVSGFDNMQARMYKKGKGRFVQPDPIGLRAARLNQPQSLNRYSYVGNDPINRVDPTGTDWIDAFCSLLAGEGMNLNRWCQDRGWTDYTDTTKLGGSRGGSGELGPSYEIGTGRGEPFDDKRLLVIRAIGQVTSILLGSNSCTRFFSQGPGGLGAAKDALGYFNLNFRIANIFDSPNTGIRMSGQQGVDVDSNGQTRYRTFADIVVNATGPFFMAVNRLNIGDYRAYTDEARMLMILHELAHLVMGANGQYLIRNDDPKTTPGQSAANTEIVQGHCKTEIDSIAASGR